MKDSFKTITKSYRAEFLEKKSRFISTISPASSEQEALDFIAKCKKSYYDARHNCSAYIIGNDKIIKHSSDDGEPTGTAGKPMLSILEKKNLYNVCACVTRYFGGVLLGTGGLVRAYSKSLERCIANAEIITMMYATKIRIEASYQSAGKLRYEFANKNIKILSSEYTDKVIFNIAVPTAYEDIFLKSITGKDSGKLSFRIEGQAYFEL